MPPRKKTSPAAAAPKDANLLESKLPCIGCESSDAFALYDDGHGFCFSEGKLYSPREVEAAGLWKGGERPAAKPKVDAELEQFLATAKPHPIHSRRLTLASCKRWDYFARRNPHGHTTEHLALYRDKAGRPVAVKVRKEEPKDFIWIGKPSEATLYGQWMWGAGGKSLIITEGEIDAISVSQVFDHKYAVVSVPGGAAGAAKSIAAQLEWINSFDKIVFMFDMDEPGQEAAQACAALIAPGKAHIAFLSEKDPNECLVKDKADEISQAFWNAKKVVIGGIVDARTLSIKCKQKISVGRAWPWSFMTRWTFGRRPGRPYIYGSGTGMGKSDFMAEISASSISGTTRDGEPYTPAPLGLFNFEEMDYMTKLRVAGKLASRRFHIPDMPEFGYEAGWTEEERDQTLHMMDTKLWDTGGRLYINEAGGNANWDDIVGRIRYLNKAEDVHEFIIDPVGAIVADMAEDNQVKFLDEMFRQAALLGGELDTILHFVSHLTRPSFGPSHEEGGQVRLSQFRGSNGIGMFSALAFGIERNQQAETEEERKRAIVRVVKDSYTGLSTGKTNPLYYDELSGTLDTENEG